MADQVDAVMARGGGIDFEGLARHLRCRAAVPIVEAEVI
jgi:hypothetical protein